ncbi:MAG: transposase [Calditrichaeota bacterium]|nr:transposase [Calditrichota bacterium]
MKFQFLGGFCASSRALQLEYQLRFLGYCLMPDHVHFLIHQEREVRNISDFMERFKSMSARSCVPPRVCNVYRGLLRSGELPLRFADRQFAVHGSNLSPMFQPAQFALH